MEQSQKYKYKLAVYEKAVNGFAKSLQIDISAFTAEVTDVIKNGRIQKFEYCSELTWKIIKVFLYEQHSIDTRSPREAVKEFFLIKAIGESDYELLTDMLNDRNKLSHIYKEEFFEEIHNKLNGYLTVMNLVLSVLKKIESTH